MMKGMMQTDSGKDMIKNMMKAQFGMEISDDQLGMMSNMMTPDTLKMAASQMGNRGGSPLPNLASNPTAVQSQAGLPQPGFPPVGASNPMGGMDQMMKDMAGGQQPGMDSLMKNKDMIKMMFGMIKTNPAMIRSITASLGPDHPVSKFINNRTDQDLQKMAGYLEKVMRCFMFAWPAIKILKDNYKIVLGLVLAWLMYRYII